MKVLIRAGGNVNQARTDDGASPLYVASENGNVETVKVLIKAGGNVNQARIKKKLRQQPPIAAPIPNKLIIIVACSNFFLIY